MTAIGEDAATRSFRLVLVFVLSAFSGFILLLPVVPSWVLLGGAGPTGAGASTAVFMATTVLAQAPLPWVLPQLGYRRALLVGGLLLGTPTLGLLLWSGLGQVLAINALRGIGFGLIVVVGSAMVAELLPREQRGRGAGAYGAAVGIPTAVCLPAGVWIAEHVSYQPMFAIGGALPLLALGVLPALRLPPVGAAGESAAPGGVGMLAGLRLLGPPWLQMVATALASSAVVTFGPAALRGSLLTPLALLAFGVTALSGRWLAGVLSDRAGGPASLRPAAVAAIAGIGLLAVSAQTGPGGLATATGVLGALGLGGGFGAVQNDTLVQMFDRVDANGYGTASTVWNLAYDGGTGLGALLIGLLAEAMGFAPAFAVTAALLAASTIGSLVAARLAGSATNPQRLASPAS